MKKYITLKKEIEVRKSLLFNQLIELKKVFPIYLNQINQNMILDDIEFKKSAISTINMYEYKLIDLKKEQLLYVYIPSNLNYLKSLEYEIIRNKLVEHINIFNTNYSFGAYTIEEYISIVREIKDLKKKYINMYKKEENVFKDLIVGIHKLNLNGKNKKR